MQQQQELEEKQRIKQEIIMQNLSAQGPLILNLYEDQPKEAADDVVEQNAKGLYQFDDSVVSVSVSSL